MTPDVPALLLLSALLLARIPAPADSLPGLAVLERMHRAHATTWYRSLVQSKRATFTGTGGRREDAWVDLVVPPARRRLDLAPLDSLDATLFLGDSLFDIRHAEVVRALSYAHPLTILLHDVHRQSPEVVARRLQAAGFDLGRVRRSSWQDRPAIVVGGRDEEDRSSPQFWVDAERLVLVRLIEPRDEARTVVQETWPQQYRRLGTAWVPARLSYFKNGRLFLTECVEEAAADVRVPGTAWRRQPWSPAPVRPPFTGPRSFRQAC